MEQLLPPSWRRRLRTLTDIRVQLDKELKSRDKVGQDTGEGDRERIKGPPSLKRKRGCITSNNHNEAQAERDTLIDVSQHSYNLVREMQQQFGDKGRALVDKQMMEIKKVTDRKSQI